MTTTRFPIVIKTDLYTSGCLPVLLEREIAAVERNLAQWVLAPEYIDPSRAYLAQLKAILEAVDLARGVAS
ncbi:hypothetical protein [Azorhizobium sp. AG788]|uniref:hypothetical protein n=1 Tax=Azorhizobium sp. AG788 TaxID=2183897 RepID=UPI00313A213D